MHLSLKSCVFLENVCNSLTVHLGRYHRTQLSEANDKMLAVQECYISVCKEKGMLEERFCDKEKEEDVIREKEVREVPENVYCIKNTSKIFLIVVKQ